MAAGKLSPRQRMINMMYLVLTALLALNVSKEVLNSFFEVSKGIERSTTNFEKKNNLKYTDFDNAVLNNEKKYGPVRDKAYSVKEVADQIDLYIQEMKYELVSKADKQVVYLGITEEVVNEEGEPIESKAIVNKPFEKLTDEQKQLPIAYLSAKSDRYASQDMFLPKNISDKKKKAFILKQKILDYRDFTINLSQGNDNLIEKINLICDVSDRGAGDKKQSWQEYNFQDMPAVSALTILSKIQLDIRNIEADVVDYLYESIDAKAIKFTSAEAIQIPQSNFVLVNDTFRAEIFISAKDTNQSPKVFVGDFDTLSNGSYKMVGKEGEDYYEVDVKNGKGMYSVKATKLGSEEWGGLIFMKTETGDKVYPFKGEYLVAAKNVVVSPTKMNVLYTGLESIGGNPITVSVPGYTSEDISISLSSGTYKSGRKKGEYMVLPKLNSTKCVVNVFANVNGKRTKIDDIEFRVLTPPKPESTVFGAKKNSKGELYMERDLFVEKAAVLVSRDPSFVFDGLQYEVRSFTVKFTDSEGNPQILDSYSTLLTRDMKNKIRKAPKNSAVLITNIKAKIRGSKNPPTSVEQLSVTLK